MKNNTTIETYGKAPIIRRIGRAFKKRQGFVLAGFDATQRWKQDHSWMFN